MLFASEVDQKSLSKSFLVLKVVRRGNDVTPGSTGGCPGYRGVRPGPNPSPGHRIKGRSLLLVLHVLASCDMGHHALSYTQFLILTSLDSSRRQHPFTSMGGGRLVVAGVPLVLKEPYDGKFSSA